ncbi:MAG: hypothetical protein JW726_18210 [Anaerolineales bacterium]|nr:hypothetical protein [Anaerolineales bacterium]
MKTKRHKVFIRIIPWLLFGLLCLAACKNSQATPFRPPTLVPRPTTLSTPEVTPSAIPTEQLTATPTPPPSCTNNLGYIEDLTVPDGTVVQPGETLDKGWLVENSGTCNWNEGYRVRLVSGPDLGAPTEQALFPARSGTQAIIHILFSAPSAPGLYQSAWQAYDPQQNAFGDPFFIQIVVGGPSPTP